MKIERIKSHARSCIGMMNATCESWIVVAMLVELAKLRDVLHSGGELMYDPDDVMATLWLLEDYDLTETALLKNDDEESALFALDYASKMYGTSPAITREMDAVASILADHLFDDWVAAAASDATEWADGVVRRYYGDEKADDSAEVELVVEWLVGSTS